MLSGPWDSCEGLRKLTACDFGVQQAVCLLSVLLRTFLLMKMTEPSVKEGIRKKEINF